MTQMNASNSFLFVLVPLPHPPLAEPVDWVGFLRVPFFSSPCTAHRTKILSLDRYCLWQMVSPLHFWRIHAVVYTLLHRHWVCILYRYCDHVLVARYRNLRPLVSKVRRLKIALRESSRRVHFHGLLLLTTFTTRHIFYIREISENGNWIPLHTLETLAIF